jgi:hypothetical protein
VAVLDDGRGQQAALDDRGPRVDREVEHARDLHVYETLVYMLTYQVSWPGCCGLAIGFAIVCMLALAIIVSRAKDVKAGSVERVSACACGGRACWNAALALPIHSSMSLRFVSGGCAAFLTRFACWSPMSRPRRFWPRSIVSSSIGTAIVLLLRPLPCTQLELDDLAPSVKAQTDPRMTVDDTATPALAASRLATTSKTGLHEGPHSGSLEVRELEYHVSLLLEYATTQHAIGRLKWARASGAP